MIKHQTQPTDNSCMSTCLAMLADLPAEAVIALCHDRYMSGTNAITLLHELGIDAVPLSAGNNQLYYGRVYLLGVQSLNEPGGTHAIIADLSEYDDWKILDPARGKTNEDGSYRNYYVAKEDHATGQGGYSMLDGMWTPEYWVIDCPAMRNSK